MTYGLGDDVLERLVTTISREPRVERIVLYGSRAKGGFRPGSDIDLSLVGSELDPGALAALENDLDDLLLPWKIDLSLFHSIENGKVLFRRGAG